MTGDILRILSRGGMQALEVLASAPLVGPLAEVASRVVQGIAEVRAACEGRSGRGEGSWWVQGIAEVRDGVREVGEGGSGRGEGSW